MSRIALLPIGPESLAAVAPAEIESAAGDLVLSSLDNAQSQIESLREELNILRRRDETLHFYMHRLDEELRLAARLQQDFLPKILPEVGPIRFHTLFRPAGYVSGDIYDIMRLDERNVGFYIADAVGHGMPAALLSMFLKQALVTKEILDKGYRLLQPSEALARLNRTLVEQNLCSATFATGLYGRIDVPSLTLTLARAGHPHPILLRGDGNLETIETEGGLLGVFDDETYHDHSIQLRPGDRVIAFSDGVEVAFGDSAVSPSPERWLQEIDRMRSLPAEKIISTFAGLLDGHSGSLDPKDDLTIVIAEVSS